MAAGASGSSRLLRATAKAFHPDSHLPSSSSAPCNASPCRIPSLKFPFLWEAKKKQMISRAAEQKAALITLGAASVTPEKQQRHFVPEEVKNIDLLLPLAYEIMRRLALRQFGATWLALTRQCWAKIAETFIHQGVVRCQSFTLIGVAGSLAGSVPCFLEGCGVVLKSFFMQFRTMSQIVDQAEIIKLLIEAIDMFLIGTALLTFGMGMYTMFYDSRSIQKLERHVDKSHLGAFDLKVTEAERRGQDPVNHAGEVEDWPRRTPAAPGRRSREVQERAAGKRHRHGLLRRRGACFLRWRLPPCLRPGHHRPPCLLHCHPGLHHRSLAFSPPRPGLHRYLGFPLRCLHCPPSN